MGWDGNGADKYVHGHTLGLSTGMSFLNMLYVPWTTLENLQIAYMFKSGVQRRRRSGRATQ